VKACKDNMALHNLSAEALLKVEADHLSPSAGKQQVPFLRIPLHHEIGFGQALCDAIRAEELNFRAEHEKEGYDVRVTVSVPRKLDGGLALVSDEDNDYGSLSNECGFLVKKSYVPPPSLPPSLPPGLILTPSTPIRGVMRTPPSLPP
jgi:hypothetical protein